MKTFGIFLTAVALVVGLVGCAPASTQYNLIISGTERGSVTMPGEGTFTYNEGEKVNLAAIPDEGYQFASWTGDVAEIADAEDSTTTITMKGNYSITATFAVKQYNLVIHSTEGGSVTTPGENAYAYDKGDVINLVAMADEGYVFIDWTGDVSAIADINAASTIITMNGGYSITANFAGAIRDWYDLDAVRDNPDGSYVLMNDLDSATVGYAELAGRTANGGNGWEPIGSFLVTSINDNVINRVNPFTGILDGRGYEIRDLFIGRPNEDGVGLFGCVSEGTIEDLGAVNAEVTGHIYVGGLVGENNGTVSDCYSTGILVGTGYGVNSGWIGGLVGSNGWEGTVSNSHSAGGVSGSWFVGGLVGGNAGTVSNSYSTGNVGCSMQHAGGLVGANWRIVNTSYSAVSVTGNGPLGGLVGSNHDGTVSNSYYSYDKVFINGRNIITIGALFNEDFEQWLANDRFLDVNERLSQEDGYYLIKDVSNFKQLLAFGQNDTLKFKLINDLDLGSEPNFYIPYLAGEFDGNGHRISNLTLNVNSIGQAGLFGYLASGGKLRDVGVENVSIFGSAMAGGLVGENDGAVSNSYCTGRIAGFSCIGGLVGWIGWYGGTVSNSYYNYDKLLINGRSMITIGALFTEDFEQWLANNKSLDVSERLSQEDGYYVINDVNDLKELLAFGQNASLKFTLKNDLDLGYDPNFYIPYLAGEFDGNGHKIRNLSVHVDTVAEVGLFGYLAPGGKVSELGVENVNVIAAHAQNIGGLVGGSMGTVNNSYSTGSVTGGNNAGGLVGWQHHGTVSNSYSNGSVSGSFGVGGLIGWNYDNHGTVNNSYSTGVVIGEEQVGGLVGSNVGTVSNSLWDTQTSGQSTSDGGTGKTTAEMKSITTFSGAGWNIVAVANSGTRDPAYIWNIVDGQTYPFLSWQA